jgi:hypothetical protein
MAAGSVARKFPIQRWCQPAQRLPGRGTCCLQIDKPPNRPDLAIYSQEEQVAAGNSPTWDSPDIATKTTSRDVQVTVRNLSRNTSAVNGVVEFSTSDFGIGVPRTVESVKRISLSPNGQIVLPFSSTSVIVPAPKAAEPHIGVHIRLEHPYDARAINNSGSAMRAEAFTSSVGRAFPLLFRVVNQATSSRIIALSLLPNELNAVVTPMSKAFAPLEQFMATLNIQVPDTFHGTAGSPIRKHITVVGRAPDGGVIGGLTCVLWIDN